MHATKDKDLSLSDKSVEEIISELSDSVKQLISKGQLFITQAVVEPGRSGLARCLARRLFLLIGRQTGIEHQLDTVIARAVGKMSGEKNLQHCGPYFARSVIFKFN